MNKVIIAIVFIVAGMIAVRVSADGKKKKKAAAREWNLYSCCHNMIDTPGRPMVITETFLVPEFYAYDTLIRGDTAFVYECYDKDDSIVNTDTLHDFGAVHNVTYFKKFLDRAHPYNDNGIKKPLPVSLIARRYERLGKDKWMSISYPGNKYEELREYRDDIVQTDTLRNSYPEDRLMVISVYRYYRVVALKR